MQDKRVSRVEMLITYQTHHHCLRGRGEGSTEFQFLQCRSLGIRMVLHPIGQDPGNSTQSPNDVPGNLLRGIPKDKNGDIFTNPADPSNAVPSSRTQSDTTRRAAQENASEIWEKGG